MTREQLLDQTVIRGRMTRVMLDAALADGDLEQATDAFCGDLAGLMDAFVVLTLAGFLCEEVPDLIHCIWLGPTLWDARARRAIQAIRASRNAGIANAVDRFQWMSVAVKP